MKMSGLCASVALGFWIAGLSAAYWKGKIPSSGIDRWGMIWGGLTGLFLFRFFLNRHFEPRSLLVELPVAGMVLLTLHSAWIFQPQIADLQHRVADPKYAGTVHWEKLRLCFGNLRKRSVQLHGVILALGGLSLGLMAALFR